MVNKGAVSGSGNVAQYATEKATELGAKVITLSDSSGTIHDQNGIDGDKLSWVMDLKKIDVVVSKSMLMNSR
ncbi:hypothetical protein Ct9H90mP29_07650 [bacterium]|nr:MAG: hypothetical protein Ct9H90mP29_07650 [bacterium]